ncbi:MAG: DUF4390 domain-containing protein, partial [Deltaproteobacteria bacterium]|nr:DUF4390 domain-containing protein [Deltaproteobacteria bacterium]
GIEEAINSGMPTIFTFKVKMYGVKRFWPDDKIGTWRFNHTVKYDSLLEEYTVTLQESGEIIKTKDFNEMKKLMSTVSDMNISPMPKLVAGKSYRIKVKAELDPVKLPFHLDYLMFFVKLWDFETEWFDHGFERN